MSTSTFRNDLIAPLGFFLAGIDVGGRNLRRRIGYASNASSTLKKSTNDEEKFEVGFRPLSSILQP